MPVELGANMRALRSEQGLTLDALAEKSGVSRAMLSDIERGAKSPTVRVLSQIAEGLGCPVSRLLGDSQQAQPYEVAHVVRRKERQVFVEPRTDVERHQLAPSFVRRGIEIAWYVIPPNSRTTPIPPYPPGTEAHITVVRGTLLCLLGTTEVVLEQGDSAQFRADIEHTFSNPDKKPCRFFLVLDQARKRA
jgi:transcriptional regulator with XRE-family HTH domain